MAVFSINMILVVMEESQVFDEACTECGLCLHDVKQHSATYQLVVRVSDLAPDPILLALLSFDCDGITLPGRHMAL